MPEILKFKTTSLLNLCFEKCTEKTIASMRKENNDVVKIKRITSRDLKKSFNKVSESAVNEISEIYESYQVEPELIIS